MNSSRDRFRKIMSFTKPDRMPYFEEGIRKDVIKTWRKQGLSRSQKLSDLFPTDRFKEIVLDLEPKSSFKNWPRLKSELAILKERLNPDDSNRFPTTWEKKVNYWKKHDQVLMLRVHRGFFLSMGVYDWNRFTDVIYLLKDDPDFVRDLLMIQGEFAAKFAKNVLKDLKIDAAVFTEPIGGNEGPLISPQDYQKFMLPSFQLLFDVLQDNGVNTFIFKTYANSSVLIPSILDFGFNCLWACETNSQAMDYIYLRRKYGKNLRLIGGIDLDALRKGKAAIRKEVEGKVPYLFEQGGYIPLADGRIRSDITFENYIYYRELLTKVTNKF